MRIVGKKAGNKKQIRLKVTDAVRLRFLVLKSEIVKSRIIAYKNLLGLKERLLFRLGLILPRGWKESTALFAAGALSLLLIFGAISAIHSAARVSKSVLGTATVGLEFLKNRELEAAADRFRQAKRELQDSNELLVKLAGPASSDIAGKIVSALANLDKGMQVIENTTLVWDAGTNSSAQDLYFYLKESREAFVAAGLDIALIEDSLRFVPGTEEIKLHLTSAATALIDVTDIQKMILNLLGGEKKTYLLIFQNNAEARATGGFIGTYGLLEFENGSMRINRIESIYNLDGQLKEHISAPGPLGRFVTANWGMRDSNWFVDFPLSARKILNFLEKEGGVLADGIISFTPDVFEQLLRVTGPIEMPEYGETLTADNFRSRVQYKTSIDYDKQENQSKKFLADFAPRFLEKFSSFGGSPEGRQKNLEALKIISQMISAKHFMMFSLNGEIQNQILKHGLGGEIKQTAGDYLAIFHSNVGGGKTDQDIKQLVEKRVSIDEFGSALVNLRITRTHEGFDEKYFPKNLDFMRILVPRGSKLISASGFDKHDLLPSARNGSAIDPDLAFWDSEITKDWNTGMYVGYESGYTAFMSWLELDPGQNKTVELVYRLPGSAATYSHLLQKQPGSPAFEFGLEILYPEQVLYSYPETANTARNKYSIRETVSGDRFYASMGE